MAFFKSQKVNLKIINVIVNNTVTPSSRPYCVPTATQGAVESPWGRSENAAGRNEDPRDADRPRLF